MRPFDFATILSALDKASRVSARFWEKLERFARLGHRITVAGQWMPWTDGLIRAADMLRRSEAAGLAISSQDVMVPVNALLSPRPGGSLQFGVNNWFPIAQSTEHSHAAKVAESADLRLSWFLRGLHAIEMNTDAERIAIYARTHLAGVVHTLPLPYVKFDDKVKPQQEFRLPGDLTAFVRSRLASREVARVCLVRYAFSASQPFPVLRDTALLAIKGFPAGPRGARAESAFAESMNSIRALERFDIPLMLAREMELDPNQILGNPLDRLRMYPSLGGVKQPLRGFSTRAGSAGLLTTQRGKSDDAKHVLEIVGGDIMREAHATLQTLGPSVKGEVVILLAARKASLAMPPIFNQRIDVINELENTADMVAHVMARAYLGQSIPQAPLQDLNLTRTIVTTLRPQVPIPTVRMIVGGLVAAARPAGTTSSQPVTLNLTYAPVINGASPGDWLKAARQHADELVRIIDSKLARRARLEFS